MTVATYRPYTTRTGLTQYKPSLTLLEELSDEDSGFCLACGSVEQGVEPDAVRYVCSDCGKHKVYGAAELALMGLFYTED